MRHDRRRSSLFLLLSFIISCFAKHPNITMAYPPSHLWWCQLSSSSAGPDSFLGVISSGHLELSTVQSPSTNWQILPSEAIYYIRNEVAGPQFQLGLSPHPFTGHYEPNLISISLSSTEQQWALEVDGDGARIQNVALGDLGFLNISRDGLQLSFGEWGNSEEIWHIEPVKMIDDPSFLTKPQISLTWSVRSVPNATSSSEPDPAASHYIPVGPAAAAIALALALILAVFLWRYSPKRRKRLERQSEVELAVVNCVPEEAASDAQEPLPQYHAQSVDDHQPPPPDYSAREEERHPQADGALPEYSNPAVG